MLLTQAIKSFKDYITMIDRSKSTITCYIQELGKFDEYLQTKHNGLVYLEDIILQDLEDFMIYEKERGRSSASRSSTLYILRSFYNYACKKDLCKKNLAVLLEPFLPFSSQKIADWLNLNHAWKPQRVQAGFRFPDISILFERLDKKTIDEERKKLGMA